ncbi:hypothetical protein HU200_001326 [Digitaria exilis]|uniref:Uncharacterized protein n=1 Tax=Digitaria exilis TaxID=1010633 RepID=A0A835G0T2_9POAL|nr:hypothetical protein HU200_001326 [Digitaria exilis]
MCCSVLAVTKQIWNSLLLPLQSAIGLILLKLKMELYFSFLVFSTFHGCVTMGIRVRYAHAAHPVLCFLFRSTLMSKFPKNVKRTTPGRDYAFKKSSHFSNGASRFEEHAFGGDIGTGEKAAYSNDDGERDEAVCNEVNNVQIDLTAGRALRDDGDIETNASLELTVERANDAGNEKADNAPPTSVQGTPVVSLNTQGCQAKSQQIALSEKAAVDEEMPTSVCTDVQNSSHLSNDIPRYEENTCLDDIPTNEESAALNDKSETVCIDVQNSSYLSNDIRRFEENTFHDDIPTNEDAAALNDNIESTAVAEEVASLEIGLNVGSAIRERGHDDITTNVYLDPTVECANKIVNEGVESTSLLGMFNYLTPDTLACKFTLVSNIVLFFRM